jgi:hypothetical protein
VVDRSLEGLCLWSATEVPVGTVLNVRPAHLQQGGWVQVEVRRCQPDADGWELGCRYLRTPTWSVRMLFG